MVVDLYAGWAVLSLFTEQARARADELARALVASGARGVYGKHRLQTDLRRKDHESLAPEHPLFGKAAPEELFVHEHDLRLAVSVGEGLSTGLFTDQRDARRLVRETSRDKRLLNLFAYTCSFTAAAALGGAATTTSVDLSQRALARGNRNLEINDLAGESHRLLRADSLSFLSRARRRGERFDLIVLDPPSFGTRGKRTFSVERDYGRVSEDALSLLDPGGRLLAVTNHQGTTRHGLRALLRRSAERARVTVTELVDLPVPADHPHRPRGEARAKSVLVTVG